MGMLRFSMDHQFYEIPRIDDELIDELFYQEDEIGEMRYFAFMIECGLEEDPPDGPDVEPIPWLDNYSDSSSSSKEELKPKPESPKKANKKSPPTRTQSMDDIFEEKDQVEKLVSPKRSPRRKMTATKSGALHGMRQKKSTDRSHSSDEVDDINLELPLAQTEKNTSPRERRKMVATKSGTLHGMRRASKEDEESDKPAPRRNKLVAAKSGTLHGMRRASKEDEESGKRAPARGKLVVTKSGTLHGMRKKQEKDSEKQKDEVKKEKVVRENSMQESSDDDDSLFSDIGMSTDDDDISISSDEGPAIIEPKVKEKKETTTKKSSKSKEEKKTKSTKEKKTKSKTSKKKDSEKDETPKEPPRLSREKASGVNGLKSKLESKKPTEDQNKNDVGSALKHLHNGKVSPADLLRNMQKSKPPPRRAKSDTSKINIPPAFRAALNKEKKRNSVSDINIPPAFRAIAEN